MSPSCCNAEPDSESHISNESLNKCTNIEASQKSAESTCCTGSECGCDDACLDQLARAICADDDGHIHSPTLHDDNHTADAISMASEDTCKCDVAEKEYVGASLKSDDDDKPKPSEDAKHTCGLRKRKAAKSKVQLPKEACGEHKSLAHNRYKDTLSAFGCVCRALLARGLQSCCTTRPPIVNSLSKSLLSLHSETKSNRSCADSCCGGGTAKSRSRVSVDSCCEDGCCRASFCSVKSRSRVTVSSCCAGGKCTAESRDDIRSVRRSSRVSIDSCSKSCCGQSIIADDSDVEKTGGGVVAVQGPLIGGHRAILAVKGMTCTGCENKLIRALGAQPGIANVKTSLVLSKAEFDYSGDAEELRALISAIEKSTGFTAEQIRSSSSEHALDLLVETSLHEKFLSTPCPDGVQQAEKVNKKTVRIVYDPHAVGAREVLSFYAAFSPVLAPEPPDPALEAGIKHIKMLLARTVLSAVFTIPVLVMAWAPLPSHPHAYAISSLILATLVQVAIAGPFYKSALSSLIFTQLIETDLLIVLSTTTAYVYSVVAFGFEMVGRPLNGGSFFETSTLLVTLIMCGQLASAVARQRAVAAISLRSLQQQMATLVTTHWDGRIEEKTVDVRLLHYDDIFRVHPDSVIITDGTVQSGSSSVDESMMTGEALPVEKSTGSEVLAGTTNGAGSLFVKVTRLPGENTISEIAAMVDDARFSRARVQSIVDRVCAWFVPVVLAIAVATFVIWILIGVRVRKQGAGEAAVKALTYAIAVLAISCPCAIGLAVPMVVLVASGVAARMGLVFKAATTIEIAKNITHVVFDKTGTLTTGYLQVVDARFDISDAEKKSMILALTSASKHPVARAVAEYLTLSGVLPNAKLDNVKEVTGKGIEGTMDGTLVLGGNAKWLGLEVHPSVDVFLARGLTTFCVTYGGSLLAVFALSDTLRPEASTVLATLVARGVNLSILSGDHAAAVNRVAAVLNIPHERVRAGCLPADKATYIRELQARGEKVMFCGDGTNDSVALAQADIGVHMSSEASSSGAAAAASSASDAVLIRPSLTGLISLVELSDAVYRRIVLNFTWSAIYNLVAVLFAAGAFVNARISPAYAGLGEVVSVLPVIIVAMQLKWFKATA